MWPIVTCFYIILKNGENGIIVTSTNIDADYESLINLLINAFYKTELNLLLC